MYNVCHTGVRRQKFLKPEYMSIVGSNTIKVQGIHVFSVRLGFNVNCPDLNEKG